MIDLKTRWINDRIDYNGEQLRAHWIYNNFDIHGDCLVAFCGGCEVWGDSMVDLADIKENRYIFSENMLHFIAEFFELDLEKAIYRQRLLLCIIGDIIRNICPDLKLERCGDDLIVSIKDVRRKMSVSIATLSSVSTLIHTGLNISSKNTPLPTIGLEDLRIDPEMLAMQVLEIYKQELHQIYLARCKVKGVS